MCCGSCTHGHSTCVQEEESGDFVQGYKRNQADTKKRSVEPCLNLAQFDSECKTKALSQTEREDMSVLFGNQEREASEAVVFVGLMGLHMTGCSGETRLVLHVPSSS